MSDKHDAPPHTAQNHSAPMQQADFTIHRVSSEQFVKALEQLRADQPQQTRHHTQEMKL